MGARTVWTSSIRGDRTMARTSNNSSLDGSRSQSGVLESLPGSRRHLHALRIKVMEKKIKVEDLEMCGSLRLRLTPDPSAQLAAAYRIRDIDTFRHLLEGSPPPADPDHWYDDPNFATMLDLASRDDNRAEFVRALIEAKADPNRINKVRKKAPIHLAAEVGNCESLGVLLECPTLDINKQDNQGNTALHLAAKEDVGSASGSERQMQQSRYRRCVQLLMQQPGINVNVSNRKGHTALHLAALHAAPEMIKLILQLGGSRLDADSFQDATGKSAREAVADKYPELARLLPPVSGTSGELTPDKLFFYLYSRESSNFIKALASGWDSALLDADDGSHTLLQLACAAGMQDVVQALLQAEVDPNKTTVNNNRPPIHIASSRGYYRIVRLLVHQENTQLDATADGETALIAAVKGSMETRTELAGSEVGRNHAKCVDILLRAVSNVDINARDIKGNTALHYATKSGDNDLVINLLNNGASVGIRNKLDEPAMANMSPKALEAYLDQCVYTNDLLPREDNYQIIFKYNFLAPKTLSSGPPNPDQISLAVEQTELHPKRAKIARHGTETEPLLYMSRSADLRYLLKHPIVTSFLHLKWERIRSLFFINVAFYIAFWILLTAYILAAGYNREAEEGVTTSSVDAAPMASPLNAPLTSTPVIAGLLAVFLILFVLRELFQFLVSPSKYVTSPENWMEIALIVVTAALLFARQGNTQTRQQLSAIAILLSWAELVLLIGRHPQLSTNIEMFKTVSNTFLRFLAWYSLLIIAFALSFYTLFRDAKAEDDQENFFLTPGMSVFKSIVMLTGEFDAGSIPFVSFPGTSHVLFVLFVFLIAIVLFNLLNGLAVSDTQAIREDAELVAYVSRVNLVSYLESMILCDQASSEGAGMFVNRMHEMSCMRRLNRRINLFPDLLPEAQIRVLPNRANSIQIVTNEKETDSEEMSGCVAKCRRMRMDPTVIKNAKVLFTKRANQHQVDETQKLLESYQQQLQLYTTRIEDYTKKLQLIEKANERTENAVNQILNLLKNE